MPTRRPLAQRGASPSASSHEVTGDLSSASLSSELAGLPEPQMLLRVLDADHAVVLARAAVFLYHPPFALQRAVDYACMPDPVEVFTAPPGWGILRSMHGLLLWLHLDADGPLVAAAGSKTFPRLLLIFEAPDHSEELSVSASYAGLADGPVPLQKIAAFCARQLHLVADSF